MAMQFDGGGFYNSGGGALPWGTSGGGIMGSRSPSALAQNYQSSYNDALNQNRANYQNIFQGYGNTLASQQAAQRGLLSNYGALQSGVQSLLETQGGTRAQEIMDQARAQSGAARQSATDRGLGNVTVADSLQRGINYDQSKALNQNNEQIAGLKASSMSQLGLAGLNAQQQAYQDNTSWMGRQLDFMNSVSAHYPDAGTYAQLAASNSGNRGAGNQGRGTFGGGGGGTPGLGYAPRAAPGYYPSGDAPSYGGGSSGGFGAWAGTPFGSSGGSPYSDPFGGAGNYAGATGTGSGGDYGGGGGGGWMGALASNYGGGGGGATLNDFYDAGGF